ncbi:hypothetical protein B0T18DRAFT_389585 [Schizothecium vesticola]|uniref:Arylamine N-acetyltransferase n=1 Tax=Schizothecium vesticola TaxID=314040 RepID=A0AA40K8M6_9PEZI|nr:hypothetical protein B0T18DRAFT_389585 [Schizothecium vesticola]
MARVPFESLSLHYSMHRTLSFGPDDLLSKIVKGSGGYCMELNTFFVSVLRSLNYPLFSVGGRVGMGGAYGGWNHQLNIVTIDCRRYVVDVRFCSNGPLQPNPPEDGREFPQIAPARGKLECKALPIHTDASQLLPCRFRSDEPHHHEMNLTSMTSPRNFFVYAVMYIRTILDDRTGKLIGLLILLRDYVKRQLGGHAEIIENLETKAWRVAALRKWF